MSDDPATLSVARIEEISELDMADLCDATEAAIIDGGGFGWLTPPSRRVLASAT